MEEFKIKTSVRFGSDALGCLSQIAADKVFIVTDPFMVESKMVDRVIKPLNDRQYVVFSKVVPDPPLELVVEGVKEVMAFRPGALVVLGGGSAIDEAKAIMHFAKEIGDLPDMEFIAIPTTSGTGSEVTSFAIITDQDKGVKYPLVDEALLPDVAVLDSNLVKSLPPAIVADTGMDVLTHALEAYVSTKANAFTDALAEKAAVTVLEFLVRSFQNMEDTEAREQMHIASCMAGLAFDRASLGVNHAIAHNIGGKFKVPHGRANTILLAHVMEFNADIQEYNPKEYSDAARKYATIARLAGLGGGTIRTSVKNLIHQIQKMQRLMNMPAGFKECDIGQDEYQKEAEAIAKGALADKCIETNPKVVTKDQILELLNKSYHGSRT